MLERVAALISADALAKALAPKLAGAAFATVKGLATSARTDRNEAARQAGAVCETALEQWFAALLDSVRKDGWDDGEIAHHFAGWNEKFASFLADEDVATQLLRPFTGDEPDPKLDVETMRRCWQAAELPFADELNVAGINRRYVKELNGKRLRKAEWRALLQGQLDLEKLAVLRGIRGAWPDFDLAKYAARFRERYQRLDLSAMSRAEEEQLDARLLLGSVFVPPDAREAVPVRELPREYRDRGRREDEAAVLAAAVWDASRPRPTRQILGDDKSRRLVLLGDPGAGKTALMRDACLHALASLDAPPVELPDGLAPFAGRLPLLIELRNYVAARAEGHCGSFLEYWHYLGESEGYALNSLDLAEYLASEPSLLVLDGLDEVLEPGLRAKIIEEIISLAHDYPQARIIVTSRIQGYRPEPLVVAGFHHVTLQELSDGQVSAFTRGWFAAVFPNAPADAEQRISRVADALAGSPPLRALAGNPLLLTMIALVARNQELPRERARLYEHALGVLVFNWDITGKYLKSAELPAGFQDRRSKLDLLRWIAWHMAEDAERLASNVISGEHLEQTIRAHLESPHWRMQPAESRLLAAAIVRQLHQRNFVLCLQGPDLYGFVHRTFLEYLIAEEYTKRVLAKDGMPLEELAGMFRERAFDDRWREILRLICGLLDEERAAVLIEAVLSTAEGNRQGNRQPKHTVVALALECLAETSRPALVSTCEEVLDALLKLWEGISLDEDIWCQGTRIVPALITLRGRWRAPERRQSWLTQPGKLLCSVLSADIAADLVAALWQPLPDDRQKLFLLLESSEEHDRIYAVAAMSSCFPELRASSSAN